MILRIDHVGFATEEPEAAAAAMSALGLGREHRGTAEAYGVACDFWAPGGERDSTAIELVSPTRPDSAVSGRVAGGGGLYHLAVEVDDLVAELARLRKEGFHPMDREPCAGARPGMQVAFVYAKRPVGLIVELVQYDS
ncbi:VOC family protein [Streptomyces sp. NPDC096354]|uniref:VOC family protein n=1 Tax=Streptomyces sp. NPDC096354 TaxID=3366088 RepID=UPI00382144E3